MKQRSPARIILLDIITLGIYDFVWLAITRNELMAKTGIRIPRNFYMVIAKVTQIAGLALIIFIVLIAIPGNNRAIENAQRPSAQCFVDYTRSSDQVRAGGPATVPADCREQMDAYFGAGDTYGSTQSLLIKFLASLIVIGVIDWLFISRWLKAYAIAAEKVINGRLSASYIILLLGLVPFFGALFLQPAFNHIGSSGTPPPTNPDSNNSSSGFL